MDMCLPLVFLCVLSSAFALPDGAPRSACQSLKPDHRKIEAQNNAAPYSVSTAMQPGNKIRVTISSPIGEVFGGFILQARSSKDRSRIVQGTFTQTEASKTMDCTRGKQNTLTHANGKAKRVVVTDFTPGDGINEDVVFRATVAKDFALFWTAIDSAPVAISSGGSSNAGNKNNRPPLYADCSESKGCFGYPSGCVTEGDCDVLMTYAKSSNGIRFYLHGYLDPQVYMAMAFSTDPRMGSDSVRECFREGSGVIVRESWNEGKDNTLTRPLPRGNFSGEFINGLTTCSWVTPFVTESNGITYNLADETYYALLAKGPMKPNGGLDYHTGGRIASPTKINFTAIEDVGSDSGVTDSVKIHGSTEEITSSPYNPTTVIFTDFVANATAEENHSSQLSINNLFLLVLLGFAFWASGEIYVGSLAH